MVVRLKKFFSNYKFVLAGLILFFVLLFVVVIPSFSEKTTASLWDGTVATSFERGNGSSEDPYIINDGSQLAYFFTLMNNSEVTGYFNQNYSLTNNIDLDNIEFPYSNDTSMFSGTFDGNGYSIYNLKITTCSNESFCELSLFGNISYATIKNLNITGGNINSSIENSKLAVLAVNSTSNTISNISINNVELNGINTSSVAGLVVNDESSEISNLNINISSESENARILISNYSNSNISNVMYNNNGIELIDGLEDNSFYAYSITENNYVHFDKNYPIESILEIVNKNSEYTWIYSNDVLRLQNKGKNDDIAMSYGDGTSVFNPEPPSTSKIENNIVYINDLISDRNYYDGLNYTTSSDHAYPTSVSKNKYNDYNLVRIQVTYSGTNFENNVTGTVSKNETENKYIYYKVYEVKDNGTPENKNDDYVEFELIDNPFSYAYVSNTTKGFNGWVTSNSNVTVSLDVDTYVRKARVAVTYNSSNKPNDLKIDFNASWINATVNNITSFSNAFDGLKNQTMTSTLSRTPIYGNCSNYYLKKTTSYWSRHPTGAVNNRLSSIEGNRCFNPLGCEYYIKKNNNDCLDSESYYKNINGQLTLINYKDYPSGYVDVDYLASGTYLAGYFEKVSLNQGNSISGYYNSNGEIQSGTCGSSGGCAYYKLIQYRDQYGNLTHTNKNGKEYYYLPTRDTNIIALNNNITISSDATMSSSKPYTLTGIVNGAQTSNVLTISGTNVKAGNDFRVENITIQSGNLTNTSSSITSGHTCSGTTAGELGCGEGLEYNSSTNYTFIGNNHNVKFGRNISQVSNYLNFAMIMGTSVDDAGSSSTPERYTTIVESGSYAAISASTEYNKDRFEAKWVVIVYLEGSNNYYLDAKGIYGSDYDRANDNDNSKLTVGYSLAAIWGHNVYSKGKSYTTYSTRMVVKSGTYGFGYSHYTSGIYAGTRGGFYYNGDVTKESWKGALSMSPHELIVEGGNIHNIMGGPSSKGDNKAYNDTYIYMKGGTTDFIFGGTGKNDTYCNKIIQLTGGKVRYSVFGGSNGSTNESSSGTFFETGSASRIYGNIFIYAGGNVEIGTETSPFENYGNVEPGSIFGSANGKSNDTSIGNVDNVTIIIDGSAKINKNVYGGANYGNTGSSSGNASSTIINVYGSPTIGTTSSTGNIFGGGNNNGLGTNDNVTITFDAKDGNVYGNIYGGSNINGTINGNAEIYFKNGNVSGSIFGGAKGTSSTTPAITGTITVNISGGTVGNVFGGFDVKGTPSSTDTINISGGTIGNVYGGGNNTANNATHINMSSGTVTGNMFGGGNNGTVNGTVTITTTGGTIDSLYGGGNGSSASVSDNISSSITNTTINKNVYGGGNAGLSSKNVTLNITSSTIKKQIFGGGNQANVNGNIDLDCTTCNVGSSLPSNDSDAIFGGGNEGSVGTTSNTLNIKIDTNSTVKGNIYAGGNNGATNGSISSEVLNTSVTGSYYGAGKGTSATVSGAISNTLTSNTFDNSFYGGGNNGAANSTITSNISNTSFGGSFYGGGNGSTATVTGNISTTITGTSSINGSVFGGGNAALSSGNVVFDATGTLIKNQLFGGGNQANVNGNIDLDCTTCNVGSSLPSNDSDAIFGGGNEGSVGTTSNTLNIKIDTNSTVKGNIYAGGNNGATNGSISSEVLNTSVTGSYYGAGKGSSATVSGTISNTLSSDTFGNSFYGGGNNGAANSTITSNISNTSFGGSFYGGGNGSTATVTGNISTTITGTSSINGSAFGGGNAALSEGNVKFDATSTTIKNQFFGGGNQANVTGSVDSDLTTCNIGSSLSSEVSDVIFGGGNAGNVGSTINLDIDSNSAIKGIVYGAGYSGTTSGAVTTTISDSTINGAFYGGGYGSTASVVGAIKNNLTNLKLTSTLPTADFKTSSIYNQFYGGGRNAPSKSTITTTYNGGSILGRSHGGGNGSSATVSNNITTTFTNVTLSDSFYAGGYSAKSNKKISTTFTGCSAKNIIGGGNGSSATVTGAITLKLTSTNASTIYCAGNSAPSKSTVTTTINGGTISYIYGGGNGSKAIVTGAVSLTVTNATISNLVYGGGNNAPSNSTVKVDATGTTIKKGIYGGGNAAIVSGAIDVDLTGCIIGTNASFSGETDTNIIGTVYGGGNQGASGSTVNLTIDGNTRVVGSVFGGGNQGEVTGDITVEILNNNNTAESNKTINKNVFGGGNAANSLGNINLTINNIKSIAKSVYGGGNDGSVGGTITTNIDSALIEQNFYGGGKGSAATVTGAINTKIKNSTINVSVYGGGNAAPSSSNITMSLIKDSVLGDIFGGGNGSTANVSGNIELDLINVLASSNVYGGGNAAVSGSSTSNTVTLKTSKYDFTISDNTLYGDTTISGSLYGGGNGSTATVKGNINVDLKNTSVSTSAYGGGNQGLVEGSITFNTNTVNVTYSIYGGGNTANVNGGITLNLVQTQVPGSSTLGVYGGGKEGTVGTSSNPVDINITLTGSTTKISYLYGGGDNGKVYGDISINILNGAAIIFDAFGGGNNGTVNGSTTITISGADIKSNLYGGGNTANVTGDSSITLNSGTIFGSLYGGGNKGTVNSTNLTISSTVKKSVYGGGFAGAVTGTSTVVMNNGTIGEANSDPSYAYDGADDNKLFGGGKGSEASVGGNVNVKIKNGNIYGKVYGGGDEGIASGNVTLTIEGGTIYGNAFGGGNNASVKSTNVSLTGATLQQALYGGGNNGSVSQTSTVVINSGTIGFESTSSGFDYGNYDRLFGGGKGSSAAIYDDINVTIKNGNVYGNIYGGGNAGQALKNVNLSIQNGNIYGNTYGGGNLASVSLNVTVNLTGGIISKNLYCGGNNGTVNKNTILNANGGTVKLSMFGGGNGSSATVKGNSSVYVGGLTTIGTSSCTDKKTCSLYGGGNAANSGVNESSHVYVNVNIAGGTIYGNVYGGGYSSTINGQTITNIGAGVTPSATLTKNDIIIKGTIYGGSESYSRSTSDRATTSLFGEGTTDEERDVFSDNPKVMDSILIEVDGNNYSIFEIDGSIFGSGNYSSSRGTSTINIYNYGEYGDPKFNKSIQRTGTLTIDNSAILLTGDEDVTSHYDTEYTLTHIDLLILKDSSTLYLMNPTSILKSFKSVDENDNLAVVTIDSDDKTVTKNTDNRLYASKGVFVNVTTVEDTTKNAWGQVYGMTFFGLFELTASNDVNVGIYDKYDYNDDLDWRLTFSFNSYVKGKHIENDDYEQNGYYSNFIDNDTLKNNVGYIIPTEASETVFNAPSVTWYVGNASHEYEPINLVAKMYSTLSTETIYLSQDDKPNTTFEIIGFDTTELNPSVQLVDKNDLPRIADSTNDADNIMALVMENSDSGWLNDGSTTFLSSGNLITGTKRYIGDGTYTTPAFNFYIYHSKNMGSTGDMGSIKVIIKATTKISDIKDEISNIYVTVNLKREYELSDKYDSALTAGRKYSIFKSSNTSITSKSAFSVYFSMFVANQNIYATGDHRSLVSTYAFPKNTKITMIDLSNDNNDYYYHVVTQAEENAAISSIANTGDAVYLLSSFIKMGAFDNDTTYNDALGNSQYYHSEDNYCDEEFIFIIDFEDTNITTDQIDNKIMFELMNSSGQTKKGLYADNVTIYSIYANTSAAIELDGTIDKDTVYSGEKLLVNINSRYSEYTGEGGRIIDTHYQDNKIGLKLSLYNNSGELVSGTSLLGLNYVIDGINYSPSIDGTTRIKIADKVASLSKWITVDIGTSNLATGDYKLVIENFASPDGIYYGLNTADSVEFDFRVVNEIYGLNVSTDEKNMIVYANSGLNLANNKNLVYNVIYNSGLDNPNIRVKMYRRNYDEVYDNGFNEVDLQTYVSNSLTTTGESNVYKVINSPSATNTVTFTMKDNLISGTYKVQFILYDGNSAVGSVDKYIIIK